MCEEHCACGHHHDHSHDHHHTPEEIAGLRRKKEQLSMLQDNMREIQQLHDKIDTALARVERENVGFILTQKKTLKELKKLADKVLGKGKEPIFATLYAAERDYIENIEDIMHHAQILKRAGQGSVTPEVVANMEKSLKAAAEAAK
ncbi:hypothetical protein [Selenomonas ruminis]|uniref:Uncharacterized protein n=1 Tax=Selenomonas ruminis TaxID=2593411 RepID=A0A5D6W4I6_9FIRM|nr:hypothetical protein [Selenomonas sp. mPRGC5]TYZ21909.1 hypothetical protein FZ040_08960 [Selenomonas sp. mPRGC5]